MFYWRKQVDPGGPSEAGLDWGFTSASGVRAQSAAAYGDFNLGGHVGDDPQVVEANRRGLAAAFGVPRDHLLFLAQTHGTNVVVAEGPWSNGEPPEADAIVTTNPDVALAVLVADCVPLLLADARAGVVAAVHAGRPGMISGIVPRTLEVMREVGAQEVAAAIGPSVCGRCYEVPEDMRAQAAAVSAVSATVSWSGTPAIDVAAGVVDQLRAADVAITWIPGCTRESDKLYSYRRRQITGRSAGVVRRWAP